MPSRALVPFPPPQFDQRSIPCTGFPAGKDIPVFFSSHSVRNPILFSPSPSFLGILDFVCSSELTLSIRPTFLLVGSQSFLPPLSLSSIVASAAYRPPPGWSLRCQFFSTPPKPSGLRRRLRGSPGLLPAPDPSHDFMAKSISPHSVVAFPFRLPPYHFPSGTPESICILHSFRYPLRERPLIFRHEPLSRPFF